MEKEYDIRCSDCESECTIVTKEKDIPCCCPFCGAEYELEDEDDDEDEWG